jgi:hypothetical protein
MIKHDSGCSEHLRLRIFSKIFLSKTGKKFEMKQKRFGHFFQDSKSSRTFLKKFSLSRIFPGQGRFGFAKFGNFARAKK